MIDFARERWTIANAEGRLLHIVGKDESEFICVTDSRDYARLVAAAPEMYELLDVWTQIQPDALFTMKNAQDTARELLARIDGTEVEA